MRWLSGTSFGFYSPEAGRKLSVKRLTTSVTFDKKNAAVPGGLYDPALGPTQPGIVCVTCGGSEKNCAGHVGHIELPVPCYQPLLFTQLYKVLQIKCLRCHLPRLHLLEARWHAARIALFARGEFDWAVRLKQPSVALAASRVEETSESTSRDESTAVILNRCEESINAVFAEYYAGRRAKTVGHGRVARIQAEQAFWRALRGANRCANCGAWGRKLRREGHSKIFVCAPSNRALRLDAEQGIDSRFKFTASYCQDTLTPEPVVDDGDKSHGKGSAKDDLDEDEDEASMDVAGNLGEVYIDQAEVKAQLTLLWRKCGSVMEAALGDASPLTGDRSDGFQKFFLEIVLVPPTRFRPSQKIGDITAEHPQTTTLQKVLASCERIADIGATEKSLITYRVRKEGNMDEGKVHTAQREGKADDKHEMDDDRSQMEDILTKIPINRHDEIGAANFERPKLLSAKERARKETSSIPARVRFAKAWMQLQDLINGFYDSAMSSHRNAPPGIRQLLERKEGLFRKHMMGKRVNYCCRSVISPDPYISSDEIGIPKKFATSLSYPESVTPHNVEELRRMVENGPSQWPGANYVELKPGRRVQLGSVKQETRMAIAKQLLTRPGQKVGRHIVDRDFVLVNRQPTLHRPGIMAHKVKVMTAASLADNQSLRMHYANCNAYNADFDGDEVNIHFPQNEVARAEAVYLAATQYHYIVPTSGKPLRGLIQDHVVATVKLSCPDCFFDKARYCQLLYEACRIVVGDVGSIDISHAGLRPCILHPQHLFSGKQLISCIIAHVTKRFTVENRAQRFGCSSKSRKGTSMSTGHNEVSRALRVKTREKQDLNDTAVRDGSPDETTRSDDIEATPSTTLSSTSSNQPEFEDTYLRYFESRSKLNPKMLWESIEDETAVLMRRGWLLRGLIDKASIGPSSMGLIHVVFEIFGPNAAANLLDALSRLLTAYLRDEAGHTCGFGDLVLTANAEKKRQAIIDDTEQLGLEAFDAFAKDYFEENPVLGRVQPASWDDAFSMIVGSSAPSREGGSHAHSALDAHMQGALAPLHSEIVKACLPSGLGTLFPQNSFALMVSTGAKGSVVNQSQISCALGQQSLEGRRVPLGPTGKSLPCFRPFDPTPRAGGFITDRFLSGIRPPEYFFHCMAGREGLIDTAVKTSRSGYLQRCLVKHLEDLVIAYDHTVRDSAGCVIQFLYGDDGLDATRAALLEASRGSLDFLKANRPSERTAKQDDYARSMFFSDVDGVIDRAWASSLIPPEAGLVENARIMVRRPRRKKGTTGQARSAFRRGAVDTSWSSGTITRVRRKHGVQTFDIELDDSSVLKRVPRYLLEEESDTQDERAPALKRCPVVEPYSQRFAPWTPGAVKQKLAKALSDLSSLDLDSTTAAAENRDRRTFLQFVYRRYSSALAAPGEAVGAIAAQSVGEPSTQMTLNTFHLAGHGTRNVTLGIPRLREIVMSAGTNIRTPIITLPYTAAMRERTRRVEEHDATRRRAFATRLNRVTVDDVRDVGFGVKVKEQLKVVKAVLVREYEIDLRLLPAHKIWTQIGMDPDWLDIDIFAQNLGSRAATALETGLRRCLRIRLNREAADTAALQKQSSRSAQKSAIKSHNVGLLVNEAGSNEEQQFSERDGRQQTSLPPQLQHTERDDQMKDLDECERNENQDSERAEDSISADTMSDTMSAKRELSDYDDIDGEMANYGNKAVVMADTGDFEGADDQRSVAVIVLGSRASRSTKRTEGHMEVVRHADRLDSTAKRSVKHKVAVEAKVMNEKVTSSAEISTVVDLTVTVTMSAQENRLRIIDIVETAARSAVIREAGGVKQAVAVDDREVDGEMLGAIVVEGHDFRALWAATDGDSDGLDLNAVESNDVRSVLDTYGVEAARATIVREIKAVFGAYGITVGARHLSLIADYMTYFGGHRAMNRGTMAYHSSPYLQMSFETTAAFLTNAAQARETDDLHSPSANIVWGQPAKLGTGSFDILAPLAIQHHTRHGGK